MVRTHVTQTLLRAVMWRVPARLGSIFGASMNDTDRPIPPPPTPGRISQRERVPNGFADVE